MSRAARARKRQTFYANEPTTPLSEIHSRKWHKRLKVIGHMHIPKWVPVDQPDPTEALQRGNFTTRDRPRQFNERTRVTRSVRQQFDAPLQPAVDNIQLVKPSKANSAFLVAAFSKEEEKKVIEETKTESKEKTPPVPQPTADTKPPPVIQEPEEEKKKEPVVAEEEEDQVAVPSESSAGESPAPSLSSDEEPGSSPMSLSPSP